MLPKQDLVGGWCLERHSFFSMAGTSVVDRGHSFRIRYTRFTRLSAAIAHMTRNARPFPSPSAARLLVFLVCAAAMHYNTSNTPLFQRRRRDFYDLDTSHWQLTGAARPADSLPGAGGTELVNERGDWEPGEDLFEKLGGISPSGGGGGGNGVDEDSSDDDEDNCDDDDDDDAGGSPGGGEADGDGQEKKKKKKSARSGGGFYEGPEACREYLGAKESDRNSRPMAGRENNDGEFAQCYLL